MTPTPAPRLVVVMGVAGSGKSAVGAALADRAGWPFRDGDSFHSVANIDKMSHGIPLDDADRAPWLAEVGRWLAAHDGAGAVVSCSALKRAYRDRLRAAAPTAVFVHLHGDVDVLYGRLVARPGHFMPPSLLASQLADLEPLAPDEPGVVLDLAASIDSLVDQTLTALANLPHTSATGA